jgi:hypothetical protein
MKRVPRQKRASSKARAEEAGPSRSPGVPHLEPLQASEAVEAYSLTGLTVRGLVSCRKMRRRPATLRT